MTKKNETKIPAKQRKSAGYKKPPVSHQFRPGQSGNPSGPPVHRTQLWTYFCRFMAMTDAKIAKLKKMTLSEQAALKLAKNAKLGKFSGSGRLMRYVVDRELGKPKEHVQIETADTLSDDECEVIKEILRKNGSLN